VEEVKNDVTACELDIHRVWLAIESHAGDKNIHLLDSGVLGKMIRMS
jgi:hypothetical protein